MLSDTIKNFFLFFSYSGWSYEELPVKSNNERLNQQKTTLDEKSMGEAEAVVP